MKKTIVISLLLGFLISCGNSKAVSDIKKYVIQIDNRTDLTELISEFKPEELKTDLINEVAIQVLKDSDEKIFKVSAELVQKDGIPLKYIFYFKNEVLNFARMTEFNQTGKDTVMDSEYYFDGSELLKQINRKKEEMEAETVRQVSEFYLVYGKEATD
ncbi:hypothetical protein EI546_00675 [Aequorivita sp. H23M31]|uniref:Lipoprotein n=1 Tax=Aequorivita ciconiae TaxID=2494375 RepID=A0A451FSF3_9FLAO|nr:hypothetical protein [Aequorivita sp. H23M31]QAA80338.1 hypothetical protein EI546_00675 [Aequorivita sp. H23M31]